MRQWRRLLVYGLLIAAVLALWTTLAGTGLVESLLLPSPRSTAVALRHLSQPDAGAAGHVGATLRETAIAFTLAVMVAVPLGLLLGSVPLLRAAYEPVLTGLSAVPLVVLYPVFAATLGIGAGSKIALGAVYAFFPVAIATLRATASVDPRLVTAARSMGAGPGRRLTAVVLPQILSQVLSGLRVGLGLALVTVIAGEFISGASGVGYQLAAASQGLDTPSLFAWVLVACLLTVFVTVLFALASSLVRKGVHR